MTSSAPAPPADIATIQRPIVGYVGGLHQWVDQQLVADAAIADQFAIDADRALVEAVASGLVDIVVSAHTPAPPGF